VTLSQKSYRGGTARQVDNQVTEKELGPSRKNARNNSSYRGEASRQKCLKAYAGRKKRKTDSELTPETAKSVGGGSGELEMEIGGPYAVMASG